MWVAGMREESRTEYFLIVLALRIQLEDVAAPGPDPFGRHADEMEKHLLEPACLADGLDASAQLLGEVQEEVLQHGGDEHEHRVFAHEGERKVRPSEVIVLNVKVFLALSALVVEEDDILIAHLPVVGDDGPVDVYGAEHVGHGLPVLLLGRALYDKAVYGAVHLVAERSELTLLAVDLCAFPCLVLPELLVPRRAAAGPDVEMLASRFDGSDDLLREGAAVGAEILDYDAQDLLRPVHYAGERIRLVEPDVGAAVTVLASDQDAAYARPSGEVAEVLLAGILGVELVGWDELVVEVKRHFLTCIEKPHRLDHVEQQRVKLFCGVEAIRIPRTLAGIGDVLGCQ